MFEAIIFDLDGTLLNTIEDITDAMNSVLREFSFPELSEERYKEIVGEGVKELVIASMPVKNLSLVPAMLSRLKLEYSNRSPNKSHPYDGITKLLIEINNRGIPIAVLSNKIDNLTKKTVKALLPNIKFFMVEGAKDDIPRKPDPTSALKIAKKLKIEPDKIMFVGDSKIDILTAINAKMFPVGVNWGFKHKNELIAAGAKEIIDTPQSLLDFI